MRSTLFKELRGPSQRHYEDLFYIGFEYINGKQEGATVEISFFYNTILTDYRGEAVEGIGYSSQNVSKLLNSHLDKFRKLSPLETPELPTLVSLKKKYGIEYVNFPDVEMEIMSFNGAKVLLYRKGCSYKIAWWEGLENL